MSPELTAWKNEGEYISYGPFHHKLFVKQLGDPGTSVEKTLLLIHGFPDSSYSFHAIVEGMMKNFCRIIQ
jgi:pimeloyl-ACP methyl ester carboxylesterase